MTTTTGPLAQPHTAAAVAFAARRPRGFARQIWGVLRWTGAIAGSLVLYVSLAVATAFIITITQVSEHATTALTVIFVSIGVGALGAALLYVTKRVFAKIVFAMLSAYLITGGFLLLVIAPVLRQMNTPELAEYRAFSAFIWFGSLALLAGIALAAVCTRWALRPHALRQLTRWSRLWGSSYGVMQGISGLFGILALFTLINADGTTPVARQAIATATIAAIALTPGLILTYHGITASMGEASSEFRMPIAAWGFAAFGLVLLVGGRIMASDPPFAAPMPLLHIMAAALPGLTLLALISRQSVLGGHAVRWLTWRQIMLTMAISMALGTGIAVYVESLGSIGALLLMLVHNGAFKYAQNSSDATDIIGNSRYILTRNEQFVANLITAAVLAPLAEEFSKGLGVRFMMRRDSTRLQAFVLGAAAGAAFGFFEGMLYGVAGIQDHLDRWWWLIMLVRGGSTTLHVFNTALVGLAWWYWSIGHRPKRALALFAAAVLSHAVWNAFAVTLDSRIFGIDTLSDRAIEVVAYIVVGAIAISYAFALPLIARRLRQADDLHVERTPLAAMAPWLG